MTETTRVTGTMTAYVDSITEESTREVTRTIKPFTFTGEMAYIDLVDLVQERTFGDGFWVVVDECIDEETV